MQLKEYNIAILEDDARRVDEMRKVLNEQFPGSSIYINRDAKGFIEWISENITTLSLLCLDHDLVPLESSPKHDPGDGRDVVRWLVSQPTKLPILIHTTNGRAGVEMERSLKEAGWNAYWTPPHDDLAWIRKTWIKHVREKLQADQ